MAKKICLVLFYVMHEWKCLLSLIIMLNVHYLMLATRQISKYRVWKIEHCWVYQQCNFTTLSSDRMTLSAVQLQLQTVETQWRVLHTHSYSLYFFCIYSLPPPQEKRPNIYTLSWNCAAHSDKISVSFTSCSFCRKFHVFIYISECG